MEENDLIDSSPERIKRLGFKPQKEIIYNKLLPYADELDEESNKWFQEIKNNLSKAVMLREIRPACGFWSSQLTTYIKLYGLKFSKEDHVALINLMYEILTIPKLEPYMVNKFAQILIILLKKKYLLPQSDLVLEWRPLYDLCSRILFSNHTHLGMYRYHSTLDHTLYALALSARYYFPENATQEILDLAKPPLSPFVGPSDDSALLVWFLPVSLPPEKANISYKLWFEDIMELWSKCNTDANWDLEIMCLIAALAGNNIGYIDWEPYIPSMFSRFLRSFNLPVTYKNQQSPKLYKVETCAVSLWIVSVLGGGSSCQKYLDKFLKTIESYFHPANFGVWFIKLKELFRKLPQAFVHRLHLERYRKRSWHVRIRETHKLTEEDIDRFVDSIKRIARQAVFSKWGCNDVSVALQKLAILRPKVIIPMLIERMYSTLDSVTEPHKLTSVMQCVVAVARTLVQGSRLGYPEGPTHVIPMLMMTLPGIDANDFRKCVVTFQFISMFVALVPIVDTSKASEFHTDLTEEEEVICAATAHFEDFVVQFFDKIFSFIESSSLETTRMEKDSEKRSKLETLSECAISSVCYSVLSQCSSNIFRTALKKLHTFLTERILETKVAGRFIAALCGRFARVNPEITLRCLVPYLCNKILSLIESVDIQNEETLDNELLYNMLILSELLYSRRGTLPYANQILAVVDKTLHITCKEGYEISSKMLSHLLMSMTCVGPWEHRALNVSYDEHIENRLLIREWGKPGDIHNLNLKWHVPGPEDIQCVREIVHKYLPVELDRINKHISDEAPLSREQLLCSLHVILGILGAHQVLPQWDEELIPLENSCVKLSSVQLNLGLKEEVHMPDGSNVKYVIVHTMDRLQHKILTCTEDDTKSLFAIIKIFESLLLNKANNGGDFVQFCKNYKMAKKVLEDPLVGQKSHVRALMIDRTVLLHEGRRENAGKASLTNSHRIILLNLLKLSCSQYSEVRSKAQASLFQGLNYFCNSCTLLTEHLLNNLRKDSIENHETFKGSLYVLLGTKEVPIIARHDWEVLTKIWPAIIETKPSEKLSVIKLLDSLVKSVHKSLPTITLNIHVPERCIELAKALRECNPEIAEPVTEKEIAEGLKALEERNHFNVQQYYKTLDYLVDALERNHLHWRYHAMAVCFIRDLVHPDIKYPPRVVRLFLNMLINDSLELRKMAIRATVFLLKQQKRPHKKVRVDLKTLSSDPLPEKLTPGIRSDNMWMQYNYETRPRTAEEWDKLRYIHKPNIGFFQWPKYLELYAPANEQPPIDRSEKDLPPEEKEVYNFFINPQNVDQLIQYFSLEEKKGKDKFSGIKSVIFKGLFRNHGDTFLEVLKPHLLRLVADKHESSQRCAAEIIAGIIRGSKLWPFEKVAALWDFLCPLIRTAFGNMSEETVPDWGICFATAAEKRDPNRHHWLLELLMEDPLRDESSFLGCGRLYALQCALNQHEWRVSELYFRLLDYFRPFLTHPFQNVRDRIAKGLTNIFQADVSVSGSKTLGPHVHDFMVDIVQKVDSLYSLTLSNGNNKSGEPCNNLMVNDIMGKLDNIQLSDSVNKTAVKSLSIGSEEAEVCIRLFKTICKWISHCLSRIQGGIKAEYFYIFPLLCLLESYDQDDELGKLCSTALAALARSIVEPEHIPLVFSSIWKVARSGSWLAKSSVIDFLQVFIFHNMFTLLSNSEWTEETTKIVLEMLEDERIEVREKAAEVLGGLLHIDFIPNTKVLLDYLKKKVNTKLKNKNVRNAELLRKRHSGILGLCSFINSSPYDVPDFVPEIFFLLGKHLNDPQPIPSTIRKTLNDFKRTHHDNWEFHQQKFTEKELEVLNDLIVPPTYYA